MFRICRNRAEMLRMGGPPKEATDNLLVETNCYREEEKRKRRLEEEIQDER